MNYYERHLGDYAKDTAHLSMLEHGAYTLLLDRYYSTEQAIPPEQVYRVARARSKDERAAVDAVLAEFFVLRQDGWHNQRCDSEIERYRESQPERDAKRENERERQRRSRERRRQMFDTLREHGVVPPYDTPVAELQRLLSRVTVASDPPHVTSPVTPVTRDNTATHTPDTRHQIKHLGRAESVSPELARAVTAAGSVCLALRQAGIADVNPSHPMLRVLLEAGATEAEFLGHAQQAKGKSHPFQWLLARVKGSREDAAQAADGLHQGPLPVAAETPRERAARERVAQATGGLAQSRPPSPPTPFAQPLETAHEPSAAAPALGR